VQSSGITPRDSKVGGDVGGESTSTCVVSGTGTSGAMVDSKFHSVCSFARVWLAKFDE